jgi:hypothetical protein
MALCEEEIQPVWRKRKGPRPVRAEAKFVAIGRKNSG